MKLSKIFIAMFLLGGCASTQTGALPSAASELQSEAPFARVALALRGCSSCSHCRSTIRQTTKSSAETDNVKVGDDKVEVLYEKPQEVHLKETIEKLTQSGLHDLKLLDVLFDADGVIQKKADGSLYFALEQTQQSFPLSVDSFQEAPPIGEKIRLRTVVQGWDKNQPLSLALKYKL